MKDLRDVKKEYGYLLRWINGGGDEAGNTWDYTFYLENVNTREKTEITNQKALDYIKKKTTNAFRSSLDIYDNYAELFFILDVPNKVRTEELIDYLELNKELLCEDYLSYSKCGGQIYYRYHDYYMAGVINIKTGEILSTGGKQED